MWDSMKRWWRYLGAKVGLRLEEHADPKVQLEQAIREARAQHRRLLEQATNVIANQKQTERQLERAIEDYEHANASARQALVLGDEEARAGRNEKAVSFNQAAEAFASKIVSLEAQVNQLRGQLLETSQASEKAKAAVAQNSTALQKKLAERQQLLSQLDQARMQEEMNKAMGQLSESVTDDVPTFDEVRAKIEKRLARAQAATEIGGASVDTKMLEVEQASMSAEAQARLGSLRAELGLRAPPMLNAPGESS
ncbi:MAG TPA: PspA/IM30 family protein [Acidimicrobiia bacterium]